mmetsp:Transcript_19677/g.52993  ORF Transcript_19677/g.52993 Transcript_19677/m.52993 type:complete len:126 (+) Transcript_19677:424-801(+)
MPQLPVSRFGGALVGFVPALRLLPQKKLHQGCRLQVLPFVRARGEPAPQETKSKLEEGNHTLAGSRLEHGSLWYDMGMKAASVHWRPAQDPATKSYVKWLQTYQVRIARGRVQRSAMCRQVQLKD